MFSTPAVYACVSGKACNHPLVLPAVSAPLPLPGTPEPCGQYFELYANRGGDFGAGSFGSGRVRRHSAGALFRLAGGPDPRPRVELPMARSLSSLEPFRRPRKVLRRP